MIVKFEIADGKSKNDYRFKVNGTSAKVVHNGKVCTVYCKGILPTQFDKMFVIRAESLSDPADYAKIQYGVFTYAKRMIASTQNDDLRNVAKAIVKYGQAVESYKDAHQETTALTCQHSLD